MSCKKEKNPANSLILTCKRVGKSDIGELHGLTILANVSPESLIRNSLWRGFVFKSQSLAAFAVAISIGEFCLFCFLIPFY